MADEGRPELNGNGRAHALSGRPGSFELSLAPDESAPGRARQVLVEFGGGLDPELRERGSVVLSELVTNCLKHSGMGSADRIGVLVSFRPDLVRMEVKDPGHGFNIQALRPGSYDGSGGWGLWLVDQMTDRWGVDFSHSTYVWCEFDTP